MSTAHPQQYDPCLHAGCYFLYFRKDRFRQLGPIKGYQNGFVHIFYSPFISLGQCRKRIDFTVLCPAGLLEYWSDGVVMVMRFFRFFPFPNTPLLQHSMEIRAAK
jgi:hypothetical protein